MPLGHYPTALPTEEAKTVISYFRTKGASLTDALEAGWWIQGYAMSMVPAGGPVTFGASPEELTASAESDVMLGLESIAAGNEDHKFAANGQLLLAIAKFLLPLLAKFIV